MRTNAFGKKDDERFHHIFSRGGVGDAEIRMDGIRNQFTVRTCTEDDIGQKMMSFRIKYLIVLYTMSIVVA